MGRLKSYHFFIFAGVCFLIMHIMIDIGINNEKAKYKKLYEQTKEDLNACTYQFDMCKFIYKQGCK